MLGLMLRYGSISESQAQAVVADPHHARARIADLSSKQVGEIPAPEFMGIFMGAVLKLIPDDGEVINVEWHYSEPGAGLRLMNAIHAFKAKGVPSGIAPELLRLAWAEEWPKIEQLLSEFIIDRKE